MALGPGTGGCLIGVSIEALNRRRSTRNSAPSLRKHPLPIDSFCLLKPRFRLHGY
jgi:hypothetical protein